MNSRFTNSSNLFFVAIYFLMLGCSKDDGPKNPVPADLLLPSNGENCNTGISVNSNQSAVEFTWSEAPNTDSYFLEVKNIQTNVKTKLASIPMPSATLTLEKGYSYEWFVTSISNDFPTERPQSDTWRFYLQGDGETNSAPFTADLISPASGEAIQLLDGAFNFIWSGADPDGDSLLYTLYVDSIDGLQIPPERQTDISSSSLSVELNSNTVYYWSVLSRDSNNNTSHSQVHSFRTIN
tara:strand:+ start:215 stop:928 length:714 start_codon:yes stop_codon:yes gene_type:complete